MTKYIFVTGGVVSSLGKGITAASLGTLLKARGVRLTMQKLDPYINYDPGTMSPYQHGEVFVTEDGAETDLDLGHYERFIDEYVHQENNVTTGRIYWSTIEKERKGLYQGQTVQVIPHITDEIKKCIGLVGEKNNAELIITEIGGTVGDIESLPFLEAIRQMRSDFGSRNVIYIHVTLMPYLATSEELKTKPTQHSVKELRSIGIQPDIIICRTEHRIPQSMKDKIALFCNIRAEEVIENFSAETIYEVPRLMKDQGLDDLVLKKLALDLPEAKITAWDKLVEKYYNLQKSIDIGLVGKYVSLKDAYISINEALIHAGLYHNIAINIKHISAEEVEKESPEKHLAGLHGILVPGGFGERGIEGKINTIRYARENKIPYLGLCLGMQCAVIEFARNVAGLTGAHSSEFAPNTPYPVIDLLPGQNDETNLGGTLRLGAYPCQITENTYAHHIYNAGEISERHRHRYEFNNRYRKTMEEKGMVFSGINPANDLVEMVELPEHPFFMAVQYHPEFKSRPCRPHPLFKEFVGSALKKSKI